MNIIKVGVVSALLSIMAMPSAFAADLYGDYQGGMKDGGYYEDDTDHRWYLRGGVGFGVGHDARISDTIVDSGLAGDFLQQDVDDGWSIGGGIGYYLMRGFRIDATLDYRMDNDFSALLPAPAVLPDAAFTGEIDSLVGLVNFYYDLDMGSRITPYVGAGLGFARHSASGDDIKGSDTTFAWALMAGADIDLKSGWKLDVGYRYLDMGEAKFDDRKKGVPAKDFVLDDLEAHEIRVGLRYSFSCWGECRDSYDTMK